ncbi:HprK-related kinase A [Chromatocurvus halotolerans]|uniref:Hpr(Ser) kinase/phosphatase n=1 Tax=Chromatocurvus halotolerans TaxID=1132028 RepID=A0A4R2KTX5_9GAMM|nr:HprK-related kinase A [Chromatocurvus halotolerans]TCO76312.1 Hpr(Ser) kinase/phosphatase [Chromatocurvus halotolerans]
MRPYNENLAIGPYTYRIRTTLRNVAAGLQALYRDFPRADASAFVDFDIALRSHGILPWRKLSRFGFDGRDQFGPVPVHQAYASLEWGMNWCVSVHCNEYLKLHAAVVASDAGAIIMPGVPGAGKSTLCAALGLSGWRILSDEHALIPPGSRQVVPLCRPVSLKNESIDVIRSFSRDAVFGPPSLDTHKGTVQHMKGDLHPESHATDPVPVRALVFPRFSRDEPQRLRARPRTVSFVLAAYHSFNYSLLGEDGFHAMRHLVEAAPCFDLVYHDLEWAMGALERMPAGEALPQSAEMS